MTFAESAELKQVRPGISVIVAPFRGYSLTQAMMQSLSEQNANPDRIEIISVRNKKYDELSQVAASPKDHRDLRIQNIFAPDAELSDLIKIGLATATFEHVVLVDPDDWVSPGLLTRFLKNVHEQQIVAPTIAESVDYALPNLATVDTRNLRSITGTPVSAFEARWALRFLTGLLLEKHKLFEAISVVGCTGPSDVLATATYCVRYAPRVLALSPEEDAIYFRRAWSVRERPIELELPAEMNERIQGVKLLKALQSTSDEDTAKFCGYLVRLEETRLANYSKEHPVDYARLTAAR
ncbi:MAG: glycosyltransferase [Candidatus Nanopelagicales bacterium]